MKIFFDGGCRPNPGAMEIALVARGKAHITRGLGDGSSGDAEWLALIAAARLARALGQGPCVLIGDAATVVRQANGDWPCRGAAARAHLRMFRDIAESGAPLRVRHVRRGQNLAGIALARARGA